MEEASHTVGTSAYDYGHRTYRCCQCGEPISLSDESEALLVQDQVDEWYRFNEVLPADEEERLRVRVREHQRGEQFSLNQYIHCRCLAPLDATALEKLREQGRFKLPTRATHRFIELCYDGQEYHCAYCRIIINQSAPGVAYSPLQSGTPVRYLHYACYARVAKQNQQPKRSLAEAYETDVPQTPRGELDPATVRRQNMAWEETMGRRQLQAHEIEAYREWRTVRNNQQVAWSLEEVNEWDALGQDTLETREALLFGSDKARTEQELNDNLAAASYPVNGELLRESRIQWNLLMARGTGPVDAVRKRKLGED